MCEHSIVYTNIYDFTSMYIIVHIMSMSTRVLRTPYTQNMYWVKVYTFYYTQTHADVCRIYRVHIHICTFYCIYVNICVFISTLYATVYRYTYVRWTHQLYTFIVCVCVHCMYTLYTHNLQGTRNVLICTVCMKIDSLLVHVLHKFMIILRLLSGQYS